MSCSLSFDYSFTVSMCLNVLFEFLVFIFLRVYKIQIFYIYFQSKLLELIGLGPAL